MSTHCSVKAARLQKYPCLQRLMLIVNPFASAEGLILIAFKLAV